MDTTQPWVVDRSRLETQEKCPRKRYLQYSHGGPGIESQKSNSIELWTGINVHRGMEFILGGMTIEDTVMKVREAAVQDAEG